MFREYEPGQITQMAKKLFREEREMSRLDGWFYAREAAMSVDATEVRSPESRAALELEQMVHALPISVSENAVFVGTQRDAFARTYALINPNFRV